MEVREPAVGPEVRARLVRRLARRGATQEDAEDAVQDALVALLSRASPSPSLASAQSWLLAVARRRLVDRHRHDRRCVATGLAEPAQPCCSYSLDPCALTDLDRVAASLSKPLRQTLLLLAEGSDARAIAAELGIGRWAAYKRIQRVRAYLRTHLPPDTFDPG